MMLAGMIIGVFIGSLFGVALMCILNYSRDPGAPGKPEGKK